MKLKFITLLLFTLLSFNAYSAGDVKEISQAEFKELVSDYSGGAKAWKFKGKRPAIIDFYANWCGPCRKVAPVMEELAKEYAGVIDFYKVNVDNAPELSAAYSVSSIPMIIFAPLNGKPQAIAGAYPKEELINAINFVFFPEKK